MFFARLGRSTLIFILRRKVSHHLYSFLCFQYFCLFELEFAEKVVGEETDYFLASWTQLAPLLGELPSAVALMAANFSSKTAFCVFGYEEI